MTNYPDICMKLLGPDPRIESSMNLINLTKIGIDVLDAKENNTISTFTKVKGESKLNPSVQRNVDDCIQLLYNSGVSIRGNCASTFNKGDYGSAKQEIGVCISRYGHCQDSGLQLLSDEVTTLIKFGHVLEAFMDLLSIS